jgi:2-iminobutanoate/2-iminopropanoate deaminase
VVKVILSASAPAPVGPYSQAICHEGLVYLSGQIPLDPATGKLVGDEIEAQTERVLENLRAVLTEAGSGFEKLLRVSVFLMDMREFPRFNAVYARMLGEARPARSTVQVAALPLGARIEIDAIAAVGG